jgi:thiol-disulfide isomerase/thioredoxin
MRSRVYLPGLLLGLALAGASVSSLAPPAAAAAPKKAACAVCSVREGAGPEAVKATATYEGKEYYFCSTRCRDEFLKDPKPFTQPFTPKPAPDFRLKTLSGETVSLSDLKGKVVLVDFWATFCVPCVKAMPKLQKLHSDLEGKGLATIAINPVEPKDEIQDFVKDEKLTLQVAIDGKETNRAVTGVYKARTLPTLYVLDPKGKVLYRSIGLKEAPLREALAAAGVK